MRSPGCTSAALVTTWPSARWVRLKPRSSTRIGDSASSLPHAASMAWRRRTSAGRIGRLQPVAHRRQRVALLGDAAVRVGAVQAHLDGAQVGARRGEPPRQHAPAALDVLVQALAPLVEQAARIAEPGARAFQLVAGAARARRARARPGGAAAPARRPGSSRTGTARSAAADGVGARRSATKSAIVKSVSWPTAEITGTRQAGIARATGSSLNAQDPPASRRRARR